MKKCNCSSSQPRDLYDLMANPITYAVLELLKEKGRICEEDVEGILKKDEAFVGIDPWGYISKLWDARLIQDKGWCYNDEKNAIYRSYALDEDRIRELRKGFEDVARTLKRYETPSRDDTLENELKELKEAEKVERKLVIGSGVVMAVSAGAVKFFYDLGQELAKIGHVPFQVAHENIPFNEKVAVMEYVSKLYYERIVPVEQSLATAHGLSFLLFCTGASFFALSGISWYCIRRQIKKLRENCK